MVPALGLMVPAIAMLNKNPEHASSSVQLLYVVFVKSSDKLLN